MKHKRNPSWYVGYFTSVAEDVNFGQRRKNLASGHDEIQLQSGPLDSKLSVLTTLYQVVLLYEPVEEIQMVLTFT